MNKQEMDRAKKFIEDSLAYISNDCGIGYDRTSIKIDEDLEHSLKIALTLLEQAQDKCTAYFKGRDGLGTCDKDCQWYGEGHKCSFLSQAGEGKDIQAKLITCPECEHTWTIGVFPPSPCGEVNSMAELKRKWMEAEQKNKRYRKALEEILHQYPEEYECRIYECRLAEIAKTALEVGRMNNKNKKNSKYVEMRLKGICMMCGTAYIRVYGEKYKCRVCKTKIYG